MDSTWYTGAVPVMDIYQFVSCQHIRCSFSISSSRVSWASRSWVSFTNRLYRSTEEALWLIPAAKSAISSYCTVSLITPVSTPGST
ncbi:hypothetical protein ACPJHQ_07090 [Rossellomorea sp. H39__3]